MNATVPDSLAPDLSSASARQKLAPQAKPYWMALEPGLHIGLYKGARTATWYARRFVGDRRYKQVKLGGAALQAKGKAARAGLDFEQAAQQARRWSATMSEAPPQPATATAARAPRPDESLRRLQPKRLDAISQAWSAGRDGEDIWLPGFFLRIEYAHFMHEKRIEQVSKAVGLSVGDLHVLLALRRSGSAMRPTDLFRELLITSGAITKRLDRLVAQHLIERVAAVSDRRSGPVKLTARGTQIADKAMERIGKSLAAIVQASGLTAGQLRTIDDGFRKLLAHM